MQANHIEIIVNDFVTQMLDKGLVQPEIIARYISGTGWRFICSWREGPDDEGKTNFFQASYVTTEFGAVVGEVSDWLRTLPSEQERIAAEFLKRVASAVDYGRAHNIDEQYVEPLREAMHAVSANLLPAPASKVPF